MLPSLFFKKYLLLHAIFTNARVEVLLLRYNAKALRLNAGCFFCFKKIVARFFVGDIAFCQICVILLNS